MSDQDNIINIYRTIYSTADLQRLGLTNRQIAAKVRAGTLERARHGVYMRPKDRSSVKSWDAHLLRALLYFKARPDTVFSHVTAAALWGLPLLRAHSTKLHTYCTAHSRGGAVETIKHVALTPDQELLTTPIGALTTDVPTTVIDCARSLPLEDAVVIADAALRRGLVPEVELREKMLAYRGRRSAAVHRVAHRMSGAADSPGETLTRLLLIEMGINFVEQYEVRVNGVRYFVDFYLPDYGVCVEFDGVAKYVDFGPTSESLMSERNREKNLMNTGARVFRTGWHDVYTQPEVFRNRLLVFLRAGSNETAR